MKGFFTAISTFGEIRPNIEFKVIVFKYEKQIKEHKK